ncbi:MAG: chromosome partitioning protein ParA, partial [Microcoleaceae cyanobacterium]
MKNSENQSVIVITGMHRSGTSLTASLLQKTGVDIGKRLVGAEYGNIKGHFENADFVEFHKSVFQFQGIDNLGCTFQREVPVPDEYQEQAHKLIAQQKSPIWGWKDPRTTLFLNFWDQLLPDAKYIFIYRS